MNLYPIWNYLVNIVQPFMVMQNECLYNALVRTMSPFAQPSNPVPLTIDALIDIRESARHLIAFIDQEIQARADEDEEAAMVAAEPCVDCGAVGHHHCPACCDIPACDICFQDGDRVSTYRVEDID